MELDDILEPLKYSVESWLLDRPFWHGKNFDAHLDVGANIVCFY